MKKIIAVSMMIIAVCFIAGCKSKTSKNANNSQSNVDKSAAGDSTIYGVCGASTGMQSLELITDQGDTLHFIINDNDGKEHVQGGLLEGDRLAVLAGGKVDGDRVASLVINLTTLFGKWTSLDKNFEIQEGGMVKSDVKVESNPWTAWKIYNGKLILNKDTFSINQLGADSLYIENRNGIFAYKRQK